MPTRDRILFILPALNEAESVGAVVRELRARYPADDIVVVDDGSTDGTAVVAAAAGARVLRLAVRLGIGAAVQTGLLLAWRKDYLYVVQVDADGQHPPSQVDALLERLRNGSADAVVGSRFLDRRYKSSLPRRVGGSILSWANSLIAGQRITDATSGFRAYNRRAFRFLLSTYADDYPEPEAIMAMTRNGIRVEEVAVEMRNRETGRSSIGARHAIYYMLKVLLAILVNATRPRNAPRMEEDHEPTHSGDRDSGQHRGGDVRVRVDPSP